MLYQQKQERGLTRLDGKIARLRQLVQQKDSRKQKEQADLEAFWHQIQELKKQVEEKRRGLQSIASQAEELKRSNADLESECERASTDRTVAEQEHNETLQLVEKTRIQHQVDWKNLQESKKSVDDRSAAHASKREEFLKNLDQLKKAVFNSRKRQKKLLEKHEVPKNLTDVDSPMTHNDVLSHFQGLLDAEKQATGQETSDSFSLIAKIIQKREEVLLLRANVQDAEATQSEAVSCVENYKGTLEDLSTEEADYQRRLMVAEETLENFRKESQDKLVHITRKVSVAKERSLNAAKEGETIKQKLDALRRRMADHKDFISRSDKDLEAAKNDLKTKMETAHQQAQEFENELRALKEEDEKRPEINPEDEEYIGKAERIIEGKSKKFVVPSCAAALL